MYTISCGNRLTAEAAEHAMEAGGNAFDGALAACFASCVTEPMLTTLAGGGIGLLRFAGGETKAVDFLTNFPSKKNYQPAERKVVDFGDETQVFYLGFGSLGVPGSLEGLLHIHRGYCELGLEEILAPAIRFAKGHPLDRLQAFTFRILEPFCNYSAESREVFAPEGELLKEGDTIRNLKFARFLSLLAEDTEAAIGLFHESIEKTLDGKESSLSPEDARSYKVHEREPVSISFRDHSVSIAPPPSAGGVLVAHALKYIERWEVGLMAHNSQQHISLLADAMQECDASRTEEFFRRLIHEPGFWRKFLKKPDRLGGTTHISVLDSEGNAAGITTSNGQGSGIMASGTGIMLNNFAAEPDLMQYKDVYRPGERITSMMSPTILERAGDVTVLGTGGSNRIRSAMLQVISNLVDFRMRPQQATDASRVHLEDGILQLEPGISPGDLGKRFRINQWTERNLFFGGVHIASRAAGGGDHRRGGAVILG